MGDLATAANNYHNTLPPEKLYLQFDRPYYASADTIWFKLYLFDAGFLNPSAKSGQCYLELVNDSSRVVKRMMLPVVSGLGYGYMPLNDQSISEGHYILRGYTNWMRNFPEEYVFTRQIYISGPPKLARVCSAGPEHRGTRDFYPIIVLIILIFIKPAYRNSG